MRTLECEHAEGCLSMSDNNNVAQDYVHANNDNVVNVTVAPGVKRRKRDSVSDHELLQTKGKSKLSEEMAFLKKRRTVTWKGKLLPLQMSISSCYNVPTRPRQSRQRRQYAAGIVLCMTLLALSQCSIRAFSFTSISTSSRPLSGNSFAEISFLQTTDTTSNYGVCMPLLSKSSTRRQLSYFESRSLLAAARRRGYEEDSDERIDVREPQRLDLAQPQPFIVDQDDDEDVLGGPLQRNGPQRKSRAAPQRQPTYNEYKDDYDDEDGNDYEYENDDDDDDYYYEDDENKESTSSSAIGGGGGNFWTNPVGKADAASPSARRREEPRQRRRRPSPDGYEDEYDDDDYRTQPTQRTFRNNLGGPQPPPRVLSELYNKLFWYGFDPSENNRSNANTSGGGGGDYDEPEKTMFGGTRGKFNGLKFLKDAEEGFNANANAAASQQQSSSSRRRRQRQEEDDYDFLEDDYDDEEEDNLSELDWRGGGGSGSERRRERPPPMSRGRRQADDYDDDYTDNDENMDMDGDGYYDDSPAPPPRSRRPRPQPRRLEKKSVNDSTSNMPFGLGGGNNNNEGGTSGKSVGLSGWLEAFMGMDEDQRELLAREYDLRMMGRGEVVSKESTVRRISVPLKKAQSQRRRSRPDDSAGYEYDTNDEFDYNDDIMDDGMDVDDDDVYEYDVVVKAVAVELDLEFDRTADKNVNDATDIASNNGNQNPVGYSDSDGDGLSSFTTVGTKTRRRKELSGYSRNDGRNTGRSRSKDQKDIAAQEVVDRIFDEKQQAAAKQKQQQITQDDQRTLSWEERAEAMERIPPAGLEGWGPTGPLPNGLDARQQAALEAQQEIKDAEQMVAELREIAQEIAQDVKDCRA
jgi:hypothetical protein